MTGFKEREGHLSTIGLELHGINSPLIPLHLTNLKAFQPQAEMLSRMMGVPENCVFVSLRRQQILAGKSLPPDALVPCEKQRTLSADFSNLSSEEKTLPCLSWSTASS